MKSGEGIAIMSTDVEILKIYKINGCKFQSKHFFITDALKRETLIFHRMIVYNLKIGWAQG